MDKIENLRFAIALSGLSSKKFETLLNKLIVEELVLCEDKQLSINNLQERLNKRYDLSFGVEEIEIALKSNLSNLTIVEDNKVLYVSLNEKGKTLKNNNRFDLHKTISIFINKNEVIFNSIKIDDIDEYVESIIKNFLYELFKSGKEEILELINGELPTNNLFLNKYSTTEKTIIYEFLQWEDSDKDKLIFDIIKSAYDYCLLSLKIEPNQTIFSRKKIYLDTNVIFSLNGINGAEKQNSANLFVQKCRELNSEIYYTSKTKIECKETINKLVDNMSSIIKKDTYLTFDLVRQIFPSSNPGALYSLYLQWCSGHPERNGDFGGFKKQLLIELDKTLSNLSLDPIDKSFIVDNDDLINKNADDLLKFKEALGRKHSENAALFDACNYVYIESQKNKKSSTINNQKAFFVTFDTGLQLWASKQCEGSANLFILLTVMYSVMLRFSNRTADDYHSFNIFISERLSNDFWDEDVILKKQELIKDIENLSYPKDIKQALVFYANNQLEEMVDSKKEKDIEIEKIIEKTEDNFFKEFEEHKDKEKEKAVFEAKETYYSKGYEAAFNKRVDELYNREKRLNTCFKIFLIIAIVGFIGWLFYSIFTGNGSLETWIERAISFVGLIASIFTIFKVKKPNKKDIKESLTEKWGALEKGD